MSSREEFQSAYVEVVNKLAKVETLHREGLADTPRRIVKAWSEMLRGYNEDPKEILATCFEASNDDMVAMLGIEYHSNCEHHMLPFFGVAHIGYIPNGKVVGASKLARLVDCYSRRLQIQERMTRQIAEAIMEHVGASGAMVVVEGSHLCMMSRGVQKQNALFKTSCVLGSFRSDGDMRSEFLSIIRG